VSGLSAGHLGDSVLEFIPQRRVEGDPQAARSGDAATLALETLADPADGPHDVPPVQRTDRDDGEGHRRRDDVDVFQHDLRDELAVHRHILSDT
jgi:hypothetical protein